MFWLEQINFPEDTSWYVLERDIRKDIEEKLSGSITEDANVDSIVIRGSGALYPPWRGQKIFFDDVRLMGYADYDVGVKGFIDGVDDLGESANGNSSASYLPVARIKNFGREPADSFLVIAEIAKGESVTYADTLPWSLPADTEDTVTFATFTPQDTGIYTLRIYTVMDPDESDADDELTKELHFTGIAEPVTPIIHLDLKVNPLCSGDVHVSYSLPQGLTGTLILFDLSGRRLESRRVLGYGSVEFSTDLATGVYIVKLEASGSVLSRKVVVIE